MGYQNRFRLAIGAKIRAIIKTGCFVLIFSSAIGCQASGSLFSIKYEDSDMEFTSFDEQRLEEGIYSYREGAAGGTTAKKGGGCGCN